MMKMRTQTTSLRAAAAGGESSGNEWEVRPGGMVVQRRTDEISGEPSVIRVRVKYGSLYHEISINSHSSFGELKKMLTGPTGLHHEDMKIIYKNKERDSKAFLDLSGAKDRSKMVLQEDPIAQEKRLLEMRRTAKLEKTSKAVSEISLEVDRLAGQVSAFSTIINKGGRVEEKSLLNLIELLMNQLLRLDAIVADGDLKLQRKLQVTRVQKLVETLDALKIKNSMPCNNRESKTDSGKFELRSKQAPIQEHKHQQDLLSFDEPRNSLSSGSLITPTTNWEIFDHSRTTATSSVPASKPVPPRFKWEFFD